MRRGNRISTTCLTLYLLSSYLTSQPKRRGLHVSSQKAL